MSTSENALSNGEMRESSSEQDTPSTEQQAFTPLSTPKPMSKEQETQAVAELLGLVENQVSTTERGQPKGVTDQDAPPPSADSDGEPIAEPVEPEQPRPPKTLKEAAQALNIDAEALYEVEIGTGDGEKVKLGELKDAWQGRHEAERESAERAAALDSRETAIIAEQRMWGELGENLAAALTPENLQQLKQTLEAKDIQERRRMVQIMPEFDDPQVFSQFRTDAVELLGKYGYKPHEVVIGDHRQIQLIRDFIRANKRLEVLSLHKPTRQTPDTSRTRGRSAPQSNTSKLVQKAKQSSSTADKIAGVAALIQGS